MKITNSIAKLRNTALVIGLVATTPLAAQAMVTGVDTKTRVHGYIDATTLVNRMRAHSRIGLNRRSKTHDETGSGQSGNTHPRQKDIILKQLP